MSATLKWRPLSSGDSLPFSLRLALQKADKVESTPTRFHSEDNDFLEGLACADVDGAQELLDLIEKHGIVELYLEF